MSPVDRLEGVLAGWPGVAAAWLFGSQARGTARPDSDVDVAVLFTARPRGFEEQPWELEARLTQVAGRPVQVVVANTAPADLVRRVLAEGQLLVDRDRSARVRFQVQSYKEYWDMAPLWATIRGLPEGVAP